MKRTYPNIRKQDGNLEPFDPEKLRFSLRRSGAPSSLTEIIVTHIENEVTEGDSTSVIYSHAFSFLKKRREGATAARYSMKRAIQELGPSGFPFEGFVAEIFKAHGYETLNGEILQGKCTQHEVDILARKNGKRIGAELKFHNSVSINSDLKVALYVDARFVDLKPEHVDEGWLITNTRFTQNAIDYALCRGLKMISWGYPKKGNLQDMIEEAGVQPVTALTTLKKKEKRLLLERGVVLCSMLNDTPKELDDVVSAGRKEKVLTESSSLCGSAKKV